MNPMQVKSTRQTTSFIENSTETGILLGTGEIIQIQVGLSTYRTKGSNAG
jgi:hypothetical protein